MRRALLALLPLLWTAGCTALPVEEGAHETRPVEAPGDALKAGTVRCTPRQDRGYDGGRSFQITVVEVDGKPVERATANAYALMRDAAAAEGVRLRVVSGFRTYAEQSYLYDCYRFCRCNSCNLAAPPGYSNHNSGYALDLNTASPGVYPWLDRNARRFGFIRTVPSEDWHWEFRGQAPAGGPCDANGQPAGPAAQPAVRFEGLRAGASYRNGQTLKVATEAAVHHVRYQADGWVLGWSEDKAGGFPLRIALNRLGRRTLQATAFDAEHHPLGEAEVSVVFTAGEAALHRPDILSPGDEGWYRNGLDLRVAEAPGVVSVVWLAGPYVLGESSAADDDFSVRYTFQELGWRVITAVGRDAAGLEVARSAVAARITPGREDNGAGPSLVFISPEADARSPRTLRLQVAASDSVARVALSADGWALGDATRSGGIFELSYRFQQTGRRRLKAEAYDADGRSVASAERVIDVQ